MPPKGSTPFWKSASLSGRISSSEDEKLVAAGPVSRILSALRRDGHSSGPRITATVSYTHLDVYKRQLLRGSSDLPGGCGAPSRHASPAKPKLHWEIPPYLVLLRVGFALPAALLRRRCALTAPFHPYLSLAARAVCFLWHFPSNRLEPAVPDVIRHTALRSSDFPLSSSPQHAKSGRAGDPDATATVRSGCQRPHYSAGDSAGSTGDNRCRTLGDLSLVRGRAVKLKPET